MKTTKYKIIGFKEGFPDDPMTILSGIKYNYAYFCDEFLHQEHDIIYKCVMLVRYGVNHKGENCYQVYAKLHFNSQGGIRSAEL